MRKKNNFTENSTSGNGNAEIENTIINVVGDVSKKDTNILEEEKLIDFFAEEPEPDEKDTDTDTETDTDTDTDTETETDTDTDTDTNIDDFIDKEGAKLIVKVLSEANGAFLPIAFEKATGKEVNRTAASKASKFTAPEINTLSESLVKVFEHYSVKENANPLFLFLITFAIIEFSKVTALKDFVKEETANTIKKRGRPKKQ